jgi:hypothetical protein
MSYDTLRSASGIKLASIPEIGIHRRHYLKSRSDLRVFSNRHPFLILRSMADLLLSNQRLFQSEDLYAFTLSHDESSLYIISIAY